MVPAVADSWAAKAKFAGRLETPPMTFCGWLWMVKSVKATHKQIVAQKHKIQNKSKMKLYYNYNLINFKFKKNLNIKKGCLLKAYI